MKTVKIFALLILIGLIFSAGCVFPNTNGEEKKTTFSKQTQTSLELKKGLLIVSTGNYNSKLQVFIDNESSGEVITGQPWNSKVAEGYHRVKVCEENTCNEAEALINSSIKTTLDFEERLMNNSAKGSLIVSIGDYIAKLSVFLDNSSSGEVSPDKPLNISVKEGYHIIKVCKSDRCIEQSIDIKPGEQKIVNFDDQLKKGTLQGHLMVSIGGFNANLPVFIDNKSVGNVSQATPLILMINEGSHEIKVCSGTICEYEEVTILFGKKIVVDFEKPLRRDVKYLNPTVRIKEYFVNDNSVTVTVEYINPNPTDRLMSATIGCGYSYIDWASWARKNDYAQTVTSNYVKAGDTNTQQVVIYFTKGRNVIASEPQIVNSSIK